MTHAPGPPLHVGSFFWTACGKIFRTADQAIATGQQTCPICLERLQEKVIGTDQTLSMTERSAIASR